jgi:hypothetical protein
MLPITSPRCPGTLVDKDQLLRPLVQSLYTLVGPEFSITLLSDLFSYDTALFRLLKKAAYCRDANLNMVAVE